MDAYFARKSTAHVLETWEHLFPAEVDTAHVCSLGQQRVVELDRRFAIEGRETIFRAGLREYGRVRKAENVSWVTRGLADSAWDGLFADSQSLVLMTHMRPSAERVLRYRFAVTRRRRQCLTEEESAALARFGSKVYVLRPVAGRAGYFEMDGAFESTRAIRERLQGSCLFMYELGADGASQW
jgi:hypothetical protein